MPVRFETWRQFTDQIDRVTADRLVRIVSRKEPVCRAIRLPVLAQQVEQIGRKHDHSGFPPFPLPDVNEVSGAVNDDLL